MRFLNAPPAQSIFGSAFCPRYICGTCYALLHLLHLNGLRTAMALHYACRGVWAQDSWLCGARKPPSSLPSSRHCQHRIIWECTPHLLVICSIHPLFWPLPPTLTHRRLLLGKAGP